MSIKLNETQKTLIVALYIQFETTVSPAISGVYANLPYQMFGGGEYDKGSSEYSDDAHKSAWSEFVYNHSRFNPIYVAMQNVQYEDASQYHQDSIEETDGK